MTGILRTNQIIHAIHIVLAEAKCPDGFPEPNNYERAVAVAPLVERAIEAAIQETGYDPPDRQRAWDAALSILAVS